MSRATAVLAVFLLVVAPIGVATPAASQDGEVTTIDSDHPLTSERSIQEFEAVGITNATLVAPALRLSIGERYDEEAGRLRGDPNYDPAFRYLRIQYNETIPRTLRIEIPDAYWHPFPSNIQSESGNAEAEFRPTSSGNSTVVTIHVSGRTDAVFKVPLVASTTYATREITRSIIENATGVDVPTLGSAEQWHYINQTALVGNETTVAIAVEDDDHVIQYGAGSGEEPLWVTVPACSSSLEDSAPVCQFTRPDDPNRVYILARERFSLARNPPPTVRYKLDTGMTGGISLGGIADGIAVTVDRIVAWAQGLLGG